MIEDKNLGVKIAENDKEALEEQARNASKQRILQMELTLEIEKEILKYLESKKTKN